MTTLLGVNNYHYRRGGAETVFLEQNELFRSAGWKVIVLCMRHAQNTSTPWDEYFVEEIEYGRDYSMLGKLRRAPKVIYSLEARRNLERLLAREPVDICHAHNIYHHLSPSILDVLAGRGVPTVMTLHDLKLACPAYKMWRAGEVCERCKGGQLRHVVRHRCIKGSLGLSVLAYLEVMVHRLMDIYARNVRRFIVPSRFLMDKLVEWGHDVRALRHVSNFVEEDAFADRGDGAGPFVYVGRITQEKGVFTLLRAAANARVPVRFVGTGPDEAALAMLAAEIGAQAEFLGYLPPSAVRAVMTQSRALVLPSECFENAPMSVLEAYAAGLPVIGANLGGIPELIREDETGTTFAPGSVDALEERLRAFAARSPAGLRQMGEAGRAWVREEFTAARYLERLLAVYEELGVAAA